MRKSFTLRLCHESYLWFENQMTWYLNKITNWRASPSEKITSLKNSLAELNGSEKVSPTAYQLIIPVPQELLEKALGGLRHKMQGCGRSGNQAEVERYREQQLLLERELSRVRLLLAHNSKVRLVPPGFFLSAREGWRKGIKRGITGALVAVGIEAAGVLKLIGILAF